MIQKKFLELYKIDPDVSLEAGERAKASFQKYERCAELIGEFIKKHYVVDDLTACDISSAFVFSLEEYLKYESSFKRQIGIKNNSVVKYMRMYKTAFNYCIRVDLIVKSPFDVYDGKLSINDAIFLTQAELNRIEEKVFLMSAYRK